MMPRWKFGMLSRMPAGTKNGIIGVQVLTSTSRVTSCAATATARLSPGTTLRGANCGSSSMLCTIRAPTGK
jgi:hypothetical protein